jgi:hypothetical protein
VDSGAGRLNLVQAVVGRAGVPGEAVLEACGRGGVAGKAASGGGDSDGWPVLEAKPACRQGVLLPGEAIWGGARAGATAGARLVGDAEACNTGVLAVLSARPQSARHNAREI